MSAYLSPNPISSSPLYSSTVNNSPDPHRTPPGTMVDIEKILATPPAGPRPEVTPEHADAIKAFKAHFGGAFRLEGKELGDRELMWLVSRVCGRSLWYSRKRRCCVSCVVSREAGLRGCMWERQI